MARRWFALSADDSSVLCCAECGNSVDLKGPSADHHMRICPVCGVECVYLDWQGRIVQIILNTAPPVFAEAIKFIQSHFDELQYVELLVAMEDLADAITHRPKEAGRVGQVPRT